MPRFFKSVLGLIILIGTIGLATCQSLVKAEAHQSGKANISAALTKQADN